jgi:hypothetical protein
MRVSPWLARVARGSRSRGDREKRHTLLWGLDAGKVHHAFVGLATAVRPEQLVGLEHERLRAAAAAAGRRRSCPVGSACGARHTCSPLHPAAVSRAIVDKVLEQHQHVADPAVIRTVARPVRHRPVSVGPAVRLVGLPIPGSADHRIAMEIATATARICPPGAPSSCPGIDELDGGR